MHFKGLTLRRLTVLCVFHAIGMDALNTCLSLTTFKSFTLVNEKIQLETFMLQL